MNTKLDLTFPHYYEVEELQEFPSATSQERRIYYPGASQEGGHDGLLVMVSPYVGQPWLGVFAFGYDSPKALSCIYSCPHGESLCVVSAGQGHIVRADDPYICEKVEAYPVLDARPLPTNRLLVFADFTKMVAYGPGGIAWTTSRLSSDGCRSRR